MNQSLRDFSDRHFEVVFCDSSYDEWAKKKGRYGKKTLGEFQRYEDASMFQKATIAGLKRLGFHKQAAFPIGWYVTLHGAMGPLSHREIIHQMPKSQ